MIPFSLTYIHTFTTAKSVSKLLLVAASPPEVNKVFVDFELPAPIYSDVKLHVRYIDQNSRHIVPASFGNADLLNTRKVHFELPESTRKDLTSFRVRIALTGADAEHPGSDEYSDASNAISE